MLATARRRAAAPDEIDSGVMMRSRLNFTSSAVSGSPLWNLRPLRRWKVQLLPSGERSHFSATPGPIPPFSKSKPTSESQIGAW